MSYDYNMLVEGLLPASLCLVILLRWEQWSQFEIFRLQHIQPLNKTASLKKALLVIMQRRAELTAIPFDVELSHVLDSRLPITD